jgi:hypothetical protein
MARAVRVARGHLARRPAGNPVAWLGQLLQDSLAYLAGQDDATLHRYLFGTVRQCGANAELAASFARWLGEEAAGFDRVATQARSLQLKLARVRRGRPMPIADLVAAMAVSWAEGMEAVACRLNG